MVEMVQLGKKSKKGKQHEEPDEQTMKRPAVAKAKSAKARAMPAATTLCTRLDDPSKVPVRVVTRSKPPATYLMDASKTKAFVVAISLGQFGVNHAAVAKALMDRINEGVITARRQTDAAKKASLDDEEAAVDV